MDTQIFHNTPPPCTFELYVTMSNSPKNHMGKLEELYGLQKTQWENLKI
jgi:hypothetical protein